MIFKDQSKGCSIFSVFFLNLQIQIGPRNIWRHHSPLIVLEFESFTFHSQPFVCNFILSYFTSCETVSSIVWFNEGTLIQHSPKIYSFFYWLLTTLFHLSFWILLSCTVPSCVVPDTILRIRVTLFWHKTFFHCTVYWFPCQSLTLDHLESWIGPDCWQQFPIKHQSYVTVSF